MLPVKGVRRVAVGYESRMQWCDGFDADDYTLSVCLEHAKGCLARSVALIMTSILSPPKKHKRIHEARCIHSRRKYSCNFLQDFSLKDCVGCAHGRIKSQCRECVFLRPLPKKSECGDCGGASCKSKMQAMWRFVHLRPWPDQVRMQGLRQNVNLRPGPTECVSAV